jgi:hypothetical protein
MMLEWQSQEDQVLALLAVWRSWDSHWHIRSPQYGDLAAVAAAAGARLFEM